MARIPLLVASHGSSVVATGLKVRDNTGVAPSSYTDVLTRPNIEQKWTDVAYDPKTGQKRTDGKKIQDLYPAVPRQCT